LNLPSVLIGTQFQLGVDGALERGVHAASALTRPRVNIPSRLKTAPEK
jgi:hypothetical protein